MSAGTPGKRPSIFAGYENNPFFLHLTGRGKPLPVEAGAAWEAAGVEACMVLARFTIAGQQRNGGPA
jgi:hypothetical protein